jgi:hypothetical protein
MIVEDSEVEVVSWKMLLLVFICVLLSFSIGFCAGHRRNVRNLGFGRVINILFIGGITLLVGVTMFYAPKTKFDEAGNNYINFVIIVSNLLLFIKCCEVACAEDRPGSFNIVDGFMMEAGHSTYDDDEKLMHKV